MHIQLPGTQVRGRFHKGLELGVGLYHFTPYAYAQLLHYKQLLKSWVLCFMPCAQLYEIDPRVQVLGILTD